MLDHLVVELLGMVTSLRVKRMTGVEADAAEAAAGLPLPSARCWAQARALSSATCRRKSGVPACSGEKC